LIESMTAMNYQLRLYDTTKLTDTRVADLPAFSFSAAISPDHKYVVFDGFTSLGIAYVGIETISTGQVTNLVDAYVGWSLTGW